ncbi:AMP-binding protein [Pigmentiphaga aceris]|uniref:AMP-binding protein n=1 Tax=Pigmentiphaga aceris TaxID=1940612 RepID=UPI001FE88200|nr:AMP-binding protein [Pigmentiphaga aceris]
MSDAASFTTVDAPIAFWARHRPDAIAIDDGTRRLSFAQLADEVATRAARLIAQQAPATVWVDDSSDLPARLVDFLGIVASGRSAAVGDPDWPPAVREQVLASIPQTSADLPLPGPETAFYVGFTSGSTGLPKGFQRHHRSWTESFRVCVDEFGEGAATRVLAPGRSSHSLFLFGMLLGLWTGAGVVVQEQFSAGRALDSLAQGTTPCLVAVPSQLLVMLALATRRKLAPMPEVQQIMISGARWMRDRTPELRALFPRARIVEFYGASETSFIAWIDADAETPPEVVGRPFGNVEIDIQGVSERSTDGDRDARLDGQAASQVLAPVPDRVQAQHNTPNPSPGEPGLIFVRSPMLFMNYVGGDKDETAALRDGDWLSVRDVGFLDHAGRLCLMGRQKRMIVTQGKNLFPEEVETVLGAHPDVLSASVHGAADALRGTQVIAVLDLKAESTLDAAALSAWCRARLEAFKTPRSYFVCTPWPLTASGKTDHAALAGLVAASSPPVDDGQPCLMPLR